MMKLSLITSICLLLSTIMPAQTAGTKSFIVPDSKFIGIISKDLKTKTEGALVTVVSRSIRLESKTKSLDPLATESFLIYGDDVVLDGDSVSITVNHPDFLPTQKKISTKQLKAMYFVRLIPK